MEVSLCVTRARGTGSQFAVHGRGKERFQGSKRAVRGIVCLNGLGGVDSYPEFCRRGDMRPCGLGG